MNVYDFDKTIYDGDSTLDFYFFCLCRHPIVIFYIPKQILGFIKYKLHIINKTQFKEVFYSFFVGIKDIEQEVYEFWNKNESKIKKWYKDNQKADDVIISASPQFLLEDICKRQNIKVLISSIVDKNTGKYTGSNCYGIEKVIRFRAQFPTEEIMCFYSDSYSDQPLADIAKNSYIIRKDEIKQWQL